MDAFIRNSNTTAMFLGYPVLIVLVFLIAWFGTRIFRDITKIFNEMKYERWKRKQIERDWENIEASFVLELDEDYEDPYPVQYFNRDTDVLPQIPWQRHDTAELPQLFNYQEELQNERS